MPWNGMKFTVLMIKWLRDGRTGDFERVDCHRQTEMGSMATVRKARPRKMQLGSRHVRLRPRCDVE